VFSVFATSPKTLRYQWRSNSVDLIGVTNATYTINNAQLAHEGSYTVVVSDVNGSVISLPAVLRVLINPVFIQNPLSQTVLVGEDVTFTAAITGNPPPFGYAWRKVSTVQTNIVSTDRETSFTLRHVTTNDSATYRVIVTNAAIVIPGVASQVAILTVLADTDGDGMPDAWEATYALNASDPSDAPQDADGDGLTNLQEYRAGTNPRDNLSYLKIESIESELATSGSMRVNFIAVSNRTYTLQYRDSLLPGNWTRWLDVASATTNRMMEVVDSPPATISKRYYRLATPRLP
jgi:Ig-like domain-containing protein/thrombospondin type 3 repeat protein